MRHGQPADADWKFSILLGVPRSSVYDYARRPDDPLPSVQFGRHRRFYRSELERWLGRRRA